MEDAVQVGEREPFFLSFSDTRKNGVTAYSKGRGKKKIFSATVKTNKDVFSRREKDRSRENGLFLNRVCFVHSDMRQ